MTAITASAVWGYNTVFVIEVILLIISLGILRGVNVSLFQKQANTDLSYIDRAVIANEV
jgi:hypothetical protein